MARRRKRSESEPRLSPFAQKVYEAALRAIALQEASEEADAELGLMIRDHYDPVGAGLIAWVLIARAAGRSDPYSHRPVVSIVPHDRRPVVYVSRRAP